MFDEAGEVIANGLGVEVRRFRIDKYERGLSRDNLGEINAKNKHNMLSKQLLFLIFCYCVGSVKV